MEPSNLGSRLKAQLSKFSLELSEGLSRPLRKFVGQMLFGVQASQDVKLSSIARSLQEKIPLIKTEDRLSRNLAAEELQIHLGERLARLGSRRVEPTTVLCLDLSDVRKEYARKMQYLDQVYDGSTGEVHEGYSLCEVTGAQVHGPEIVPLYQKLYSTKAPEFRGENQELLQAVDWVGTFVGGRGIWAMDRGGDRRHLLEPLLERRLRFVIRSTGARTVIDRRHLKGTVAEVAGRCRLACQAKVIKIEEGKEKVHPLRYGAEAIRLPGRSEKLLLVVVAGFGRQPLRLLTNLAGARDSESLWRIVEIYLTRWKIEETLRFLKQSYHLEDLRVLSYRRLQNLAVLVLAAAYFATTFLGQKMKHRLLCEKLLIISARFFGIPPFRFYALADAIRQVLSRTRPPATPSPPPDSWPLQLFLAWHG